MHPNNQAAHSHRFAAALRPLLCCGILLLPFSQAQAAGDFDSPQISADVALCSAVYKLSAATATDDEMRKQFQESQKKYEQRLAYNLSAQAPLFQNIAMQELLKSLRDARANDPANGAANKLIERQKACVTQFETPDSKPK